MPYDEGRANEIIGESRNDYKCNQVVNYILDGVRDNGMMAEDYLKYGLPVHTPAKGVVIAGKTIKGEYHVGVFVDEMHFIHSSSSRNQVVKVPYGQAFYIWGDKFELRRPWF